MRLGARNLETGSQGVQERGPSPQTTSGIPTPAQVASHVPPQFTTAPTQVLSAQSMVHDPVPQSRLRSPQASTPLWQVIAQACSAGQVMVAVSHASSPSQLTAQARSSGQVIVAEQLWSAQSMVQRGKRE